MTDGILANPHRLPIRAQQGTPTKRSRFDQFADHYLDGLGIVFILAEPMAKGVRLSVRQCLNAKPSAGNRYWFKSVRLAERVLREVLASDEHATVSKAHMLVKLAADQTDTLIRSSAHRIGAGMIEPDHIAAARAQVERRLIALIRAMGSSGELQVYNREYQQTRLRAKTDPAAPRVPCYQIWIVSRLRKALQECTDTVNFTTL